MLEEDGRAGPAETKLLLGALQYQRLVERGLGHAPHGQLILPVVSPLRGSNVLDQILIVVQLIFDQLLLEADLVRPLAVIGEGRFEKRLLVLAGDELATFGGDGLRRRLAPRCIDELRLRGRGLVLDRSSSLLQTVMRGKLLLHGRYWSGSPARRQC